MPWPSLGDYNAAFANPASGLPSPLLRGARTKVGPMGAITPISGGFAFIYELGLPDGSRRAVRCFVEDELSRRERTRRVCGLLERRLAAKPALRPYFAEALWVEDCVVAGGNRVPAMVMEWVEGQTLGQYIEARHHDPAALARLRKAFSQLVLDLEAAGIVHGDLQTGNIVVEQSGSLRLLDYDGLHFAGEDEGPDLEAGHVNFQHPAFSSSSPSSHKDRFPALVIDLGLAALIEEPDLFDRFSTGENILFVREDFRAPTESAALEGLRAIPSLAHAGELLALLCQAPVEALPTLADFAAEMGNAGPLPLRDEPGAAAAVGTDEGGGRGRQPGRKRKGGREPYSGQYPVLEGTNYGGLFDAVGRKVEVVARVVSVKADGVTKYGDPFVFVNFGDWRSESFKLAIWSEGLSTFAQKPGTHWEGRWLSVTGLIDEPYTSRYGVTQLSITVQDSSQLRFIEEAEALFRMGSGGGQEVEDGGSNSLLLRGLASAPPGTPSNAELLSQISGVGRAPPPAPAGGRLPATNPRQAGSPSGRLASPAGGCLTGAGIVIGIIILLAALSGAR
ncbi:MAG: AarF/UbiB family protein [Spirochaetota bacterium]